MVVSYAKISINAMAKLRKNEDIRVGSANMLEEKKWQSDFDEYIRQGEPEQAEKSEAWQIAIGLQQVDGLKTSAYLLDTAKEHIEGKISIKEAQRKIYEYYEEQAERKEIEDGTEEADIVSSRIAELLGEKTFQFSPIEYQNIHRRLFTGVFMIKYIKTFGMNVDNEAFKNHSWYFRNALVRANYNNLKNGIHATTKYLEMFFSNLLLGTEFELKNRFMHVDFAENQNESEAKSVTLKALKVQNDTLKCTLEEMAVLKLIMENPSITQKDMITRTGKSLSTIKRIMASLQEKEFIKRVNGKRYGRWEIAESFAQIVESKEYQTISF